MAKKTYRCPNNHEFEADDEFSLCPQCDLPPEEEVKTSFFNFNGILERIGGLKIVLIVIALLAAIIIINSFGSSDEVKFRHELNFTTEDDYIKIGVVVYEIDDQGEVLTKKPINFGAYPEKFNDYQKAFNIELEDDLDSKFEDNKVYVCSSGQYTFRWKNSSKYPLKNAQRQSKSVRIVLPNEEPNSKAECKTKLRIEEVKGLSNCRIKVITSADKDRERTVEISINGINGKYIDKREFSVDADYKYNIYCREYNSSKKSYSEPIPYLRNGNPNKALGCIDFDEGLVSRNLLESQQILNQWGQDPTARTNQKRVNKLKEKNWVHKSTKVYLNGELKGSFEDAVNDIYRSSRNCSSCDKYKLKNNGIVLRKNSSLGFRIETIYLITI